MANETDDEKPNFPDELFVIEDEVECASHVGHAELVEIATQATPGDYVQKYRKVGKPIKVVMENRQQQRVLESGSGKPLTPWQTWEENHGAITKET